MPVISSIAHDNDFISQLNIELSSDTVNVDVYGENGVAFGSGTVAENDFQLDDHFDKSLMISEQTGIGGNEDVSAEQAEALSMMVWNDCLLQ